MADQKISALTAVTAPSASDVVPIVNAGATKKVEIKNLVKLGNVAIWARVYHNAAQSIPNNTATTLAFNSERNDTDTIHDTVTNNSRLTCKTAGVYAISGTLEYATNATGERSVAIRLNGTTYIAAAANSGGISVTQLSCTTQYIMAVNDYIELIAFQDSGGALNVNSTANYSPEFMMTRLGA